MSLDILFHGWKIYCKTSYNLPKRFSNQKRCAVQCLAVTLRTLRQSLCKMLQDTICTSKKCTCTFWKYCRRPRADWPLRTPLWDGSDSWRYTFLSWTTGLVDDLMGSGDCWHTLSCCKRGMRGLSPYSCAHSVGSSKTTPSTKINHSFTVRAFHHKATCLCSVRSRSSQKKSPDLVDLAP